MPNKSVCVVGHGPSMVGKGLGEVIDKHNVVIRMVEWGWQNPIDYGDKYNIGIYCQGPSKEMIGKEPKLPSQAYWKYLVNGNTGKDHLDITNSVNLRSNLKRKISRGTAAFICAYDLLESKQITLAGFDAVRQGQYNEDHHPEQFKNYMGNRGVRTNTHDWRGEMILIMKMVDFFDIQLRWLP